MRKDGAEGEKENKGVSDCTVRTGDDVEVVSFKLSARLRLCPSYKIIVPYKNHTLQNHTP